MWKPLKKWVKNKKRAYKRISAGVASSADLCYNITKNVGKNLREVYHDEQKDIDHVIGCSVFHCDDLH